MAVPLLDVAAQNLALEKPLTEAFNRLLHSGQFILGSEVLEFEREAARSVGAKHAIGISSGTDALLVAMMALGVQAGDEVLCPSYTFFATAGCVVRLGATPVFVDSDPVSFNLVPAELARKATERTKGIIPVHLFGQCVEMDPVLDYAKERGIWVLEDAAQAFGARQNGRFAGTMGEFGACSFFPSKNLGGLGDGGLLLCNDDALAEKARILRNHGAQPKYYHKWVGGNFRLDALQAAFLRIKLQVLEEYNARRRSNAEYYSARLSRVPGFQPATAAPSSGAKVLLPGATKANEHIWNQYTLRVLGGRRNALREHLLSRSIGCEIYYPVPLEAQECFASLRQGALKCPVAARLAEEALSIPVYPELTPAQQDEVIEAILEFYQ